ncbi:hypothetical protein E4191_17640 (plasmid) [Paracoccus liaowanqingii]|uniref:Uncharacterized protein n=1 Tax=Paracoccus liaowanqingii TaxID=2560053 RepID=A0A4Y5SR66_9RHOB|nr:hypothetical protein [Paracoccus liaowanqingii]QDA35971.1 hypothetical protein E4191_17640 [Paracoccus liaowanqingii]
MTDPRSLAGTDQPQPDRRSLSCGPSRVTLEEGRLRHLRVDGVEAIRGLAFLVRDRDWGTVAPRISDLRIDETPRATRVTYRADHDLDAGLSARVTVQLTAQGLDARVQAVAAGEVWTNRAGFTLLHPILGVAGAPLQVDHADGTRTSGQFPDLIAPWQPFRDIVALTHQAGPWRIACRFIGDVFEMEDQRQWGDASFKTYNRPLALPWPYRLTPKAGLDQSVSIRWWQAEGAGLSPVDGSRREDAAVPTALTPPAEGSGPTPESRAEPSLSTRHGPASDRPLAQTRPRTPLQTAPPHPRFPKTALLLTGADARRAAADPGALRSLAPQRLLCHLNTGAGDLAADLQAFAALQAVHPGPAYDLELIAACPPDGDLDAEFRAYADALAASGLRAAAIMVTPAVDRQSTPPGSDWPACPPLAQIYAAARRALPGLPLGGGSASFFPELNRKRPPAELLDFVTHGLCPIVHAADDASVIETLEAVPQILASVRAIAGAAQYRLGPSTIAMRHNPYGSRTVPNPDRRRICLSDDDPRQDAAFAAAWTCGLATALARAGLTVWTPAELYGPRGLVRTDGSLRPVAAVVAALSVRAGHPVHAAHIMDDLALLHLGDEVIVANLSPQARTMADGMSLPGFGWQILPAGQLPWPPIAHRSGMSRQEGQDEQE